MRKLYIEKCMEEFLRFEDLAYALLVQRGILANVQDPDQIMAYYGLWLETSQVLRESGTQVFVFDPDAQREIALTDNPLAAEEVYETFPYDAAYIMIEHPVLDGFAVVKDHEAREVIYVFLQAENYIAEHSVDSLKMTAMVDGRDIDGNAIYNLVCYIASANADINLVYTPPVNGAVLRNPKKKRSSATVTQVGYHIGSELREYRKRLKTESGEGCPIRPHIRRAHWHRFWTGPLGGDRKLVLKWLAPIFVKPGHGEMVPTVHPVRDAHA